MAGDRSGAHSSAVMPWAPKGPEHGIHGVSVRARPVQKTVYSRRDLGAQVSPTWCYLAELCAAAQHESMESIVCWSASRRSARMNDNYERASARL